MGVFFPLVSISSLVFLLEWPLVRHGIFIQVVDWRASSRVASGLVRGPLGDLGVSMASAAAEDFCQGCVQD